MLDNKHFSEVFEWAGKIANTAFLSSKAELAVCAFRISAGIVNVNSYTFECVFVNAVYRLVMAGDSLIRAFFCWRVICLI